MKQIAPVGIVLLLLGLSGCSRIGDKAASLLMVYGATAVLSLLLLIGYCCLVPKKDGWFITLFSSVTVVNAGYLWLGLSTTLTQALWANRLAYLGSAVLPMAMLIILLRVTKFTYPKWLPLVLAGVGTAVFLIAASPDILTVYYKEVTLQVIGGVTTLNKVYGPLHCVYMYYLVGYFVATVAVTLRAFIKKVTGSTAHSVILAIAVFVNLGVWLIEQLVKIDFEFLAISYIISESFLLGFQLLTAENERLKALVKDKEKTIHALSAKEKDTQAISPELLALYREGISALTPTEKVVYEAYLAGKTTKEVLSFMNIKENTLKYHNRNLYSKLGVSSRKELMAFHNALKETER